MIARLAERFELYACGVELANGFGELTDAAEQRARFTAEMDEKERVLWRPLSAGRGFPGRPGAHAAGLRRGAGFRPAGDVGCRARQTSTLCSGRPLAPCIAAMSISGLAKSRLCRQLPASMTDTTATPLKIAQDTSFAVLFAISFCHLLNDMMQALLPAIYPTLKADFHLSFAQIGVITAAFQCTASLLQPWVGYASDRRPMPYSLPLGMVSTLIGLLVLWLWRAPMPSCCWPPCWWAWALRYFIPNPPASRAWRRAAGMAWRNRCFRSAAISARRWARSRPPLWSRSMASAASPGMPARRSWASSSFQSRQLVQASRLGAHPRRAQGRCAMSLCRWPGS